MLRGEPLPPTPAPAPKGEASAPKDDVKQK
jgi:hypothetical protein